MVNYTEYIMRALLRTVFHFLAVLETSKFAAFLLSTGRRTKALKHLHKIRCVEIPITGIFL